MNKKVRRTMKQVRIVIASAFACILVATAAFAGAPCCAPGQGAQPQTFSLFPQVAPAPQSGVPAGAVAGAPAVPGGGTGASCCPQYSGARGCRAASARSGGCCGAVVNPRGCCGPAVNSGGCCGPNANTRGGCPVNVSPRGCCPPNSGTNQPRVPSTSWPMVAPQATLAVNCGETPPRGTLGALW